MPKPITSLLDQTLPFASSARSDNGQLEPDFTEAYNTWKGDDNPVTRGALLTKVRPVIDSAIHSYGGSGGPTVQGQAKLMAMKAFGSYDPSKGSMRTHLLSQLRGLQRVAAQSNQIISIPERVALDRNHLTATADSLRDDLGRDPSDMELAARTGLSLKRINHIRQSHSGVNTGSILDDEGEVYDPASTIPGAQNNADSWAEMVYYDLPDIDRKIMEHSLGLRGAKILSGGELAANLGLSQGAISQRKARIQQLLDEQFEIDPFGGR
jgi:DNA-directed RNA polymerase specialized sigma subunit